MSCSPFDLRDYFFEELSEPQRRQTEAHVKACATCREELDRLRGTHAALLTLPDEEIPQRIGFVSDPVFQPPAWRRGWDALWGSAARLGFVSAAMLSIALVTFALRRPLPPPGTPAPAFDRAALEADFSKRLHAAVQKAVAESEARQTRQTQEVLAAAERRHTLEDQAMIVRVQEYMEVQRKHLNTLILTSNETGGPDGGAR